MNDFSKSQIVAVLKCMIYISQPSWYFFTHFSRKIPGYLSPLSELLTPLDSGDWCRDSALHSTADKGREWYFSSIRKQLTRENATSKTGSCVMNHHLHQNPIPRHEEGYSPVITLNIIFRLCQTSNGSVQNSSAVKGINIAWFTFIFTQRNQDILSFPFLPLSLDIWRIQFSRGN